MASLLLSLQAYSHSGPETVLKGTTAVQGLVQVEGSSTVNLYSIVSASLRVKYSVIFNVLASAFRYVFSGRKLVVSTTKVSRSQWPRPSPCHWWMFAEG